MPTISDVAQQAGVSAATVSRVIQGAKNVSPATRERVERAIEELGYVPSAVAQSLRSKRTRSLALVVSDITNTFWTTVARGVEDAAQSHGYSVLLGNSDENLAKQLQYLNFVISQQVDGVIIAPFDSDARHLDKLRRRDIPTVVIDRRIDGWDVDSVRGDSVAGARALVRHLLSLGHTKVAMVSGPATTSTAEDRVLGYRMALAEAGIPIDERLIQRGEFRTISGEELTYQLLDKGLEPTAIFAANNLIAMGVIDALVKRGLRIPQDVALVCFDDLPNASRLFPFLTVMAQPVYDMGVHAAQLLLSRLSSEVTLQPRHVILPSRLIVRQSCGSKMLKEDPCVLTLPLAKGAPDESIMVQPLSPDERRGFSVHMQDVQAPVPRRGTRLSDHEKSDVDRLLKVLQHEEADRLPHLELWVTSQRVFEYVLERELEYDAVGAQLSGLPVGPEDHVDFALRLGMDAVPCPFAWQPDGTGPDDLEPPPSLTSQLSYLERYLRAAQGTGVGVIASFSSFFQPALKVAGLSDTPHQFRDNWAVFRRLMDTLLDHQERVMRVVCDRFAYDLAFVAVRDDIAREDGLAVGVATFNVVFPHRMERLVAPAQEHGKLLLMHASGRIDQALSILHEIGFDAIYPSEPQGNGFAALRQDWAGRLALVGSIPTSLLARGSRTEIADLVREYCAELGPGGGYVLGSSGGISKEVPPENFVAMTRAVHRFGRYGTLGQDT